ncbi:MAG: MFS transporter [Micropepsaceae bacterium]
MSALARLGIGTGGAPRAILFFACSAHFLHHVLVSLYLTLVLTLTNEWRMSYGDLIALWTVGSMMIGLGAPLAGWLGDRWGEARVMTLLFFGLGAAAILCGLAQGPLSLKLSLAVLGAFGALYHPVGNSWVVKHARERGKAIALAGIAGSFGVAAGPVIAGSLNDVLDWRWAFIIPGAITAAFGVALLALMWMGRMPERDGDAHETPLEVSTARERRNVIALLALTMTLTLIATTAFVTALPKLVEDLNLASREGLIGVGLLVGAIHLAASGAQFLGGHYADRGAARRTYILLFVLLAVAFAAAALTGNWLILPLAIAAMFLFEAIAPIETVFVARYAPAASRGLFFGMRYAISVVGGPVGVWLVAALYDPNARFAPLLFVLAAGALAIAAVSVALPRDREVLAAQ